MKRQHTNFLGLFNQPAAAAPAPQSQATQTTPPVQQPPQQPVQFDANNPQVQAAMALAREQERSSHHQNLEQERNARQAAEQRAQHVATELQTLQATQTQAVKDAEDARIQGLPKAEKFEARITQLQEDLQQRDAKIEATVQAANQRIEQWQMQAEVNRIVAETHGKIEIHMLDTQSLQALRNSVPQAMQAYEQRRVQFFTEFQQQTGNGAQAVVEGLAPGPQGGNLGLPSGNNASSPAPAAAMGNPQFTHPQIDGGASYAQVQEMLHGRVQQAVPPAGGNYFPPQQGYPPQGWQQMPPNPNVQQPAAMMQQGMAPMPDPSFTNNGMKGMGMRDLSDAERDAAVQHAQATIARFRQGPQRAGSPQINPQTGLPESPFPPGAPAPANHPAAGQPMPQPGGAHPMIRNT